MWIIFFYVFKISIIVFLNKNEEGNWCLFLICLYLVFYGMVWWFMNVFGIIFDL